MLNITCTFICTVQYAHYTVEDGMLNIQYNILIVHCVQYSTVTRRKTNALNVYITLYIVSNECFALPANMLLSTVEDECPV